MRRLHLIHSQWGAKECFLEEVMQLNLHLRKLIWWQHTRSEVSATRREIGPDLEEVALGGEGLAGPASKASGGCGRGRRPLSGHGDLIIRWAAK